MGKMFFWPQGNFFTAIPQVDTTRLCKQGSVALSCLNFIICPRVLFRDTNKLNKLVRKACSAVRGVELDSLEEVMEKRILLEVVSRIFVL